MNNIVYAVSVDVNNPIIPYNVYVASVLDSNVRYLEITLYQNGNVITLSNTATATASLVTDNVLVNDSVNCTIQDNIITVPLEDLQRHGNLDVQVTVTEGTKVLAIPFPIQVRVTPNIAENAQIDENSLGSYAEVVHEIIEARGAYTTLHDALSTKAPASTAYTFDRTTTNVVYNTANPKTIYLNATVDGEAGIVITAKDNGFQYFLGRRGALKIRYFTGGTSYSDWTQVTEHVDNKKNSITSSNRTSTDYYPSIKAVVDYLAANYLGSGDNTVSWANLAAAVQTVINAKEVKSNKKTTLTGNASSNDYYPTTKAVADALSTKAPLSTAYTFDAMTTNVVYDANNPKTIYTRAIVNGRNAIVLTTSNNYFQFAFCHDGTEYIRELTSGSTTTYNPWALVNNENTDNKQSSITAVNKASTALYPSIKAVVDYLVANYENLSNKLTSEEGIDSNSTDTEYPSAKAVYDLGVEIIALVNDDISNVESRLVLKESFSNKKNAIAGNETSGQYYPTTKAVYDYGSQISSAVEDVKAYIGYTSGDILGLHADFENKVFTRLGAAVGLNAGSDFDAFPMYGQRRRVVVGSDGEIIDNYSPEDVGESDTDVDVMVYQPKFYYKVVPLKLEKQSSGLGYHIRKANYYISSTPHDGFKLHPLFYDGNGNEIDYVLFSAYEASYMWRRQVSTNGTDFRYVDSIFHDGVDTDTTIETNAVLKSLPGVKPISGQYKAMNKVNMENCALGKSSNWHLDTIKSVSANQLLMTIEYGAFNTQSAIGHGVVSNANNNSNTDINCSSLTGSTSAATFNTDSGMASETIYDVAGSETPFNTNGKLAISYRGMENPWGNIWKHTNGINLFGDGTEKGCQIYIAEDFNFNESVKGEVTISGINYRYCNAGFTMSNATGYVSAFGYGNEKFDWLFIPSEVLGTSSVPVGDNCQVLPNATDYRIVLFGGNWSGGANAGDYCVFCNNAARAGNGFIGGRLLFVPTAAV